MPKWVVTNDYPTSATSGYISDSEDGENGYRVAFHTSTQPKDVTVDLSNHITGLTAGTSYSVGFWYKASFSANTVNVCNIYVRMGDEGAGMNVGNLGTGTNGWQWTIGTWTPPGTVERLQVSFGCQLPGTASAEVAYMAVDGFQAFPATSPTTSAMVSSSSIMATSAMASSSSTMTTSASTTPSTTAFSSAASSTSATCVNNAATATIPNGGFETENAAWEVTAPEASGAASYYGSDSAYGESDYTMYFDNPQSRSQISYELKNKITGLTPGSLHSFSCYVKADVGGDSCSLTVSAGGRQLINQSLTGRNGKWVFAGNGFTPDCDTLPLLVSVSCYFSGSVAASADSYISLDAFKVMLAGG